MRKQAAHQAAVERRGGAFAADIAHGDDGLAAALLEDIVDVAGDFARGAQADGGVEAGDFGLGVGEEDALQFARRFEIFLHAALALRELGVEARVFDGAGDLRRKQGEGAHVIVAEVADAVAFEIHHADHAVLHDQRHGDLGADIGVGGDVARIFVGVVDADDFARFGGGAGEALAERNVVDVHALVVADAEEVLEGLRLVIDGENAEGVVVHQVAHGAGDFAEQLVEVEDGGEFARDIGEGFERAVLALDAAVEARVIDGGGDARGDEAHEGAVVFVVGVDAGGLQVDDADELAAGGHGDGELGADRVHGVQIARIVAHVADEHGFAGGGGDAGDAFAQGDGEVADDLVAMADAVADVEIAAAVAI